MDYSRFLEEIKIEAKRIVPLLNQDTVVRLISHLDADGLCSAGIISRLLLEYNKKFHLTIVKQLEAEVVESLKKEKYDLFFFTDIGSGQLNGIKKLLENSKVIIIDHHPPEIELEHPNLIHINPHKYGIDGGSEICASTLSYLVVKSLGVNNCEHLAIVGSIGDRQEINGELNGVNKYILDNIDQNIKVKKGLRVFGRISKPLHKAIAYSTETIPGISGNESSAIQFLSEIGLGLKNGEIWRNVNDLTDEEEQILVTNIIIKRLGKTENPEGVIGNVYTFKNKKGLLADAHEFATLLNSCGRQNMQSIGIMLCLGEETDALEAAEEIMGSYKRKLLKAINWVRKNKNDINHVLKTEKAMYILGESEIDDTIIGTICSILAESDNTDKDILIGFANSTNGIKVSGRVASKINFDIGENIERVVKLIGGEGGGHHKAGGAKIPFGKEKDFINEFERIIKDIKGQKIEDLAV